MDTNYFIQSGTGALLKSTANHEKENLSDKKDFNLIQNLFPADMKDIYWVEKAYENLMLHLKEAEEKISIRF